MLTLERESASSMAHIAMFTGRGSEDVTLVGVPGVRLVILQTIGSVTTRLRRFCADGWFSMRVAFRPSLPL
jgi:hypothetical protein